MDLSDLGVEVGSTGTEEGRGIVQPPRGPKQIRDGPIGRLAPQGEIIDFSLVRLDGSLDGLGQLGG